MNTDKNAIERSDFPKDTLLILSEVFEIVSQTEKRNGDGFAQAAHRLSVRFGKLQR